VESIEVNSGFNSRCPAPILAALRISPESGVTQLQGHFLPCTGSCHGDNLNWHDDGNFICFFCCLLKLVKSWIDIILVVIQGQTAWIMIRGVVTYVTYINDAMLYSFQRDGCIMSVIYCISFYYKITNIWMKPSFS